MRIAVVLCLSFGCGGPIPDDQPAPVVDSGTTSIDSGSPDAGAEEDAAVIDGGESDAGHAAPTVEEIQAIVSETCSPCHTGPFASGLLNLDDFVGSTVGVPAHTVVDAVLIVPGDQTRSYLMQKIRGTAPSGEMPPFGAPERRPSNDEVDRIGEFVDALQSR